MCTKISKWTFKTRKCETYIKKCFYTKRIIKIVVSVATNFETLKFVISTYGRPPSFFSISFLFFLALNIHLQAVAHFGFVLLNLNDLVYNSHTQPSHLLASLCFFLDTLCYYKFIVLSTFVAAMQHLYNSPLSLSDGNFSDSIVVLAV